RRSLVRWSRIKSFRAAWRATKARVRPHRAADAARPRRRGDRIAVLFAAVHLVAIGRYCCKSLFALVITIPPGCRRDFRVKMWGTSSPDDKLTGDLGNVIETTQIGGRRSDRLTAGNLSPGNFGLLQHNRHEATVRCDASIRSVLEVERTLMDVSPRQ